MEQHFTVTAGVHWSERNKCLKKILWIHPVFKMKLKRWKFYRWDFIVMKGWKTEILRQVKMETTFYMCALLVTEQCLCIQPVRKQWLTDPNKIKHNIRNVSIKSHAPSVKCSSPTEKKNRKKKNTKKLYINWKHWTKNCFLQNCYLLPDILQAEQKLNLSGELFIRGSLFSSAFDIH